MVVLPAASTVASAALEAPALMKAWVFGYTLKPKVLPGLLMIVTSKPVAATGSSTPLEDAVAVVTTTVRLVISVALPCVAPAETIGTGRVGPLSATQAFTDGSQSESACVSVA